MTAQSKIRKNQRGDTLVEVMLATVIMSIIVTASFALINRATRVNQLSSERSESVNAMQFQAEALRYYRDNRNNNGTWEQIKGEVTAGGLDQTPGPNNCRAFMEGTESEPNTKDAFYFRNTNLDRRDFNVTSTSSSNVSRYFVWIEPYGYSAPNHDYLDFYIHVCWPGPGGTGPQEGSLIYRLVN